MGPTQRSLADGAEGDTTRVREAPQPRRLGGLLILAFVALFAFPLQFVAASIPAWISVSQYGLDPIWDQDPRWVVVTAWHLASTGALAVLSLYTLPQLWRKRLIARKLMIGFFAGAFVVGVVNHVIGAVSRGPSEPPPNMLRVILSTAIVAGWIGYFSKSERVRETLLLP